MRILQCIEQGALNKVSVFPNLEQVDLQKILKHKNVRISLHLNLIEGKCMTKPQELDLIVDKNGNFKHTFGGLFKLSLFGTKRFQEQIYKEIRTQVLFFKKSLPQDAPFCIDSHQHTHMIPIIFKTLIKVLNDEKIDTEYIRIPAEPVLPYIKTPSLYSTYNAVNLIKQWLLNLLWLINKKILKLSPIPTAYFFGILFSGKMDKARVTKILPKYINLAKKDGKDIEVLFHPAYLKKNETDFKDKNIVFQKFYLSENRKTEFDSVMNISERSVQ